MNAHRTSRPFAGALQGLVVMLAVLGLIASLVSGASAQDARANSLSHRFVASIETGTPFQGLSADAVLHTPDGDFIGRTGPAEFGQALAASFSNVEFATHSAADIGSGLVMITFTLTGINTGSYRGVEANCAGVAVPGVAVLHVDDVDVPSDSWTQAALGQYLDGYPVTQASLVVEQWIGYDGDLLASQIADFNAIDANSRPGCAQHVSDAPASRSVRQVPAHVAELPW